MDSLASVFVFLAVFPIGWILGKIAWLVWLWAAEIRARRQPPPLGPPPLIDTSLGGYWGVGMVGTIKAAPAGAMWLEAVSPYPAQLVCARCAAPWHELCGACAMEEHVCVLAGESKA